MSKYKKMQDQHNIKINKIIKSIKAEYGEALIMIDRDCNWFEIKGCDGLITFEDYLLK
tara:strand:- start:409 stop:582 length:174 start_codon:yes stop_codon:yes gene_type:complete